MIENHKKQLQKTQENANNKDMPTMQALRKQNLKRIK